MKITIEEVLAHARVDRATLELWMQEHWIAPDRSGENLAFSEADLARAQLIGELIEDIGVNDAGVGVILDLLDQVHGLRRLVIVLKQQD